MKLNDPIAADGYVVSYTISPDSSYVVYQAVRTGEDDTNSVSELYSVPIEGGTPTKLNHPLSEDGDVVGLHAISPDSRYVVYRAEQDTFGTDDLYSVPLEGGTPTKLNHPLPEDGSVVEYTISPDSRSVVYTAQEEPFGIYELYSVSIEGSTPAKLNSPLAAGGNVNSNRATKHASCIGSCGRYQHSSCLAWASAPDRNGEHRLCRQRR